MCMCVVYYIIYVSERRGKWAVIFCEIFVNYTVQVSLLSSTEASHFEWRFTMLS